MTDFVTPTGLAKTGTWDGRYLAGEELSEQQKLALKAMRRHRYEIRHVNIETPREPTDAERGWGKPRSECVEKRTVACPILNRSTHKDEVLSPSGERVWLASKTAERKRK